MATRNLTPFLDFVRTHCDSAGVKLILNPSLRDAGVFDYCKKTLSVRVSSDDWYLTLAHEAAHLFQWLGPQREVYMAHSDGYDEYLLWLQGKKRLTAARARHLARATQKMELDAERKALRMIRQWRLCDDLAPYIREANCYVWSYEASRLLGRWPSVDSELHAYMPGKLMPKRDIARLPDAMKKAFNL